MIKKTLSAICFSLLCFSNAYANDLLLEGETSPSPGELAAEDIYIYDFGYGGNGCPKGSVDAVLSADYKKISLFFDEYYADSSESRRGRERKSCNLGVAVHVPHGLSVALVELDYRGFVDVPKRGFASLTADYFFAGQEVGAGFTKKWGSRRKAIDQDFTLSDKFLAGAIVWSACGQDAIIRANTSIKAYKNRSNEHSYIQVDTIDAEANIIYQLQWKECR